MESRLSSDRLGPVETLRIDYRHRRTFTVETTDGGDGFSYTGSMRRRSRSTATRRPLRCTGSGTRTLT